MAVPDAHAVGILDADPSSTRAPRIVRVMHRPAAVAVSPDGGRVYAVGRGTDEKTGTLSMVEVREAPRPSRVVETIRVGNDPRAALYDADGTTLYVADYGSGSVSVVPVEN